MFITEPISVIAPSAEKQTENNKKKGLEKMSATRRFAIPALFAFTLTSNQLYAASAYQNELSLSYSDKDDDSFTVKAVQANFTYYLKPVDISTGPLAEAAFSGKNSAISARYSSNKFDAKNGDLQVDSTAPAIGILYITDNAYVFGMQYSALESETSNELTLTVDSKTLVLRIGKYITDTLRVTLQYQKTESDFKTKSTSFLTSSNDKRYQLAAKKLFTLSSGKTINLTASYSYGINERFDSTKDNDNRFNAGADYYLSNSTSIGVTSSVITADNKFQEGKSLGLNFKKFITQSFAFSVGINRFLADDNLISDSDTIDASVTARF